VRKYQYIKRSHPQVYESLRPLVAMVLDSLPVEDGFLCFNTTTEGNTVLADERSVAYRVLFDDPPLNDPPRVGAHHVLGILFMDLLGEGGWRLKDPEVPTQRSPKVYLYSIKNGRSRPTIEEVWPLGEKR